MSTVMRFSRVPASPSVPMWYGEPPAMTDRSSASTSRVRSPSDSFTMVRASTVEGGVDGPGWLAIGSAIRESEIYSP